MAEYTLRTWQVETITCTARKTRTRIDAAVNEMYRQAYAVLAAFGKLDTVAAHRVLNEVTACDDIIQIGEQRTITVSNTGYSVTLVRES